MNRRVLLLLVVILVLVGAVAVVLLTQNQTPVTPGNGTPVAGGGPVADTPVPIILKTILVAVQDLPRGIKIPDDGIDARNWPAASVPQEAIGPEQKAQIVGRYARTFIPRETPILATLIVDDLGKLAAEGSDAALQVPAGLVAIAVPIDRITGTAYALRDGDHVDVITSLLFTDVDQNFQSRLPNQISFTYVKQDGTIAVVTGFPGRLESSSVSQFPAIISPIEAERPRLTVQRTVQNAIVIHVGTFPTSGSFISTPTPLVVPTDNGAASSSGGSNATAVPSATPALPDVVTIAVSPQDAVALTWFIEEHTPLTLTLRNTGDSSKTQTAAVTLNFIISNYQITVPPKLPYALEPAIRSIREVISETLVPFPQDQPAVNNAGR